MEQGSFIEVAPESHFPIQNLPYGIFSSADGSDRRPGVAIGEWVADLAALEASGLLTTRDLFNETTLNRFMAAGTSTWSAVRTRLKDLLAADNPILRDDSYLRQQVFHPIDNVTMHLPAQIGDYTDFYSSREHATNVGAMFRSRESALLENWLYLPVAYHGRASSIVVSGTDIRRPFGQMKVEDEQSPQFGPSQKMDFELEVGYFIGGGNSLGQPIPVDEASDHVFGLVLVNDWSARDIQAWEYRPLGPFLGKNLGTAISPWIVPLEALAPFACEPPNQDPAPLPYLTSDKRTTYGIHLEVRLEREADEGSHVITRSNFKYLYWTIVQQVAHHTVTGCNLRSGDLLATGTISGPTPDSSGSMLELAWGGKRPLQFPDGDRRSFLADGDRVTLTGWCQGNGYRVGLGECSGMLLPAHDPPSE